MSKGAKGGMANDEAVLGLFTPVQIAEMQAQAEAWKNDGAALVRWIEDGLLFDLQVVQKLASGEVTLARNPGPVLAKALIEFPKLAEKVLKLVRTEKEDA